MSKKGSDSGVVGGLVFVVVVIALVPKPVWIVLGVVTATAVLIWVTRWAVSENNKRRTAAAESARVQQAAQAAAAKRERAARAAQEKQQRIDALGTANAALVESALAAVKQVRASEAARAGWLGDVDFTADIRGITDNFHKAHALRKVASQLSALSKPSIDDRRILAEAKTTATTLEGAATERVELVAKCAMEALLVDESLRGEREDARTAEQRAELHAKLSAMIYGIEATPDTTPIDSAADAVMARVQAYQEVKNLMGRGRDV